MTTMEIEQRLLTVKPSPQRTFVKRCVEQCGLLPVSLVANLAGVSRQRVHQFMDDGRLKYYDYEGRKYIGLKDLMKFCEEREVERLKREKKKNKKS